MATLNINSLQHKNSSGSVVSDVDGSITPKLPNADKLAYGEIAINYAANLETLSIKNSNDAVVTFSSDTIIYNNVDNKINDIKDDLASVVSVQLGNDTEEGKNFLKDEDVDERNQVLAVRSIDANATKLNKDIVVAGMSGQFGAGNYENNDVIPAGTDIYTILQNILCKELYANPKSTSGTMTATIAKPTVSLDKSGTVEVGTLITMNSATVANSTVSTTPQKVEGMEFGYSATDDDSVDNTEKTISKSWTTTATGGDYKMSATVTGFNADTTTNVQTVPATVNAQSMSQTVLGCAAEGSNTITVSVTGDTFTGSVDGIDSVYHCSNLGNTDAAKKTDAIAAITDKVSNVPTNSQTKTVTGQYKYFMGNSTAQVVANLNSDSIRGLEESGWTTVNGTTTIQKEDGGAWKDGVWTSNGNSIVIACPNKYTLNTITDSMGNDYLVKFKQGTVSVVTSSINTEYNVYIYQITNGTVMQFKNITLK